MPPCINVLCYATRYILRPSVGKLYAQMSLLDVAMELTDTRANSLPTIQSRQMVK